MNIKYNKLNYLFLLLILLLFTQCEFLKKNNPEPEQLPPATTEGKRTFGCLVNGKPWIPGGCKGFPCTSLQMTWDNAGNGRFGITATKVNSQIDQKIGISVDSLFTYGEGTYDFECKELETNVYGGGAATFKDLKEGCYYFCPEDATITSGFCKVSRFDLQKGIISGTFEFTLTMPDCETIEVTEGRFDMKL